MRGAHQTINLSPRQSHAIKTAALQLPSDQHAGFILRCEDKLVTRGYSVADSLVADVIANVLAELVRQ